MSTPVAASPAPSDSESVAPSQLTPTTSASTPKVQNDTKTQLNCVFEFSSPTSLQIQHLPEDSLHAPHKDSIDSYLTRFLFRIHVTHSKGNQDFFVHRDLLVARSKFFKGQTTDPKTIGSQLDCQTFELHGVGPTTFALYTNLLYTKRLLTSGPHEWQSLCRLYILAERLQDMETKNTVIDSMFSFLQETHSHSHGKQVATGPAKVDGGSVKWLYEHTPENSPARRLAVDFYAQAGRAEWLQAEKEKYPTSFVWDVAVRLMQRRSVTSFASGFSFTSASHYHESIVASGTAVAKKKKAIAE